MELLPFIELKNVVSCPDFCFKYSNQLLWKYCYEDKEIYEKITECKNKIDDLQPSSSWDRGKKINNKYELIHLPNKRVRGDSISIYEPLSRSYFKMWELIHEFPIDWLSKSESIKIMGIAEGPGGFIEALHNYRKKYNPNNQDKIIGITLYSNNNDIPGWKKAKKFLSNNKNIIIDYGKDNSGNIYHIENIKYFYDKYKNTIHIATADGGFDFSDDFNHQEQKSYHIIFCEMILAMSCLKENGVFICKIFDIFSKTTVSLLQFCKAHFDSVIITKPHTSRPCNSEKYIICRGFQTIDDVVLQKAFVVIACWEHIDKCKVHQVSSIFDERFLDTSLLNDLYNYTKQCIEIQTKNIVKTLLSIENKQSSNHLLTIQRKCALEWCKKYDVEVNHNSKFLQ